MCIGIGIGMGIGIGSWVDTGVTEVPLQVVVVVGGVVVVVVVVAVVAVAVVCCLDTLQPLRLPWSSQCSPNRYNGQDDARDR